MYVRTTYATGDPAEIGAAIDALRTEAPGLLQDQPGYRGFGLFADRELGKIIVSSWWESEQAQQDSDARLKQRRAELLAPFATTATTDVWEAPVAVPSLEVGAGAGFRLNRMDFDPATADRLVEVFRTDVLPRLQAIDGFTGTALLIDRARGRGSVGVLFHDRAALVASRGPQAAVRGRGVAKSGVALRSIEEFEVILAERRG